MCISYEFLFYCLSAETKKKQPKKTTKDQKKQQTKKNYKTKFEFEKKTKPKNKRMRSNLKCTERKGFEPLTRFRYIDLANQRFKPLSHLSIGFTATINQ